MAETHLLSLMTILINLDSQRTIREGQVICLGEAVKENELYKLCCMYSCNALESFLNQNNLSHVIRAHEVKQAGFQVRISHSAQFCISLIFFFLVATKWSLTDSIFFLTLLWFQQRGSLCAGR